MKLPVYDVRTAPLEGITLVEASAGTGKTFTITTLVLRLIVERNIDVRELLVMTYTRAATAELRDRVRARLEDALAAIDAPADARDETLRALFEPRRASADVDRLRVLRALRSLDEASIFTIHGYCQRALADHSLATGAAFDVELLAEDGALVTDVAADFRSARFRDESLAFARDSDLDMAETQRLIRMASEKPRTPLVPGASTEGDPYAALAPLIDEARRIWAHARESVAADFRSPILDHNKVRQSQIAGLLEDVDRTLADPQPHAAMLLAAFDRVRVSFLRDRTKKGAPIETHPFLTLGEAIHAEATATLAHVRRRVRREAAEFGRRTIEARKRRAGVRAFDDLLLDLLDALDGPHGARLAKRLSERWRAALVDEFQDTDEVQYDILKRVYAGRESPVFLVGDPKQAIYSFRGADVSTYLHAARASEARRFALGTSYRSDASLVAALAALYERSAEPFGVAEIGYPPIVAACPDRLTGPDGDAPITVLFADRDARELEAIAEGIAMEVVRLLDSDARIDGRRIRPEDVAVLCRTNHEARVAQAALRRRGIPGVFDGDRTVFEGDAAMALEHLLAAIDDPRDPRKVRNALATPIFGATAHELASLGDVDSASTRDWPSRFAVWHEQLVTRGVVSAVRSALEAPIRDGLPAQAALLRRPDGERWLTDLLHLVEILHDVEHRRRLHGESLVQWYRQTRESPRDELAPESSQLRIESDRRALRLTTVHRSKGLEFPIVFAAFLDLPRTRRSPPFRFHDPDDGGRLALYVGPPKAGDAREARAFDLATEDTRHEELRLLYVALTRAKHRTYAVLRDPKPGVLGPLPRLLLEALAPSRIADGSWTADAPFESILASAVETTEGRVIVRPLATPTPAARYVDATGTGDDVLEARELEFRIDGSFRSASFSRLVRDAGVLAPLEAEGVDRDEAADREATDRGPTTGEALAGFPRGTRTGLLVHEALEHLDFQAAATERRAVLERCLRRHRFEPAAHLASLDATLTEFLATPLGPDDFVLAALPRARRIDELEFLFPVAGREGPRLTPERLANVLRTHGSDVVRAYARRVERLGFPPLAGFLQGFVDLVAEHRERFYVVDYKTNDLGPREGDYASSALDEAMIHHDYLLQALIYSVALHRFLAFRIPGYDYDRSFGGIRYLFVRGMSPSHAPGSGVFAERPSRALVEALDSLFRSPEDAS